MDFLYQQKYEHYDGGSETVAAGSITSSHNSSQQRKTPANVRTQIKAAVIVVWCEQGQPRRKPCAVRATVLLNHASMRLGKSLD